MANINKLYSDIDPEMKMDWNKDVSRSLGLRSIKNSLLGIITTRDVIDLLTLSGDYRKLIVTGNNLDEELVSYIDVICEITLRKDNA